MIKTLSEIIIKHDKKLIRLYQKSIKNYFKQKYNFGIVFKND